MKTVTLSYDSAWEQFAYDCRNEPIHAADFAEEFRAALDEMPDDDADHGEVADEVFAAMGDE